MANDKRKQSLYFPAEILAEMEAEATRTDRSLSWLAQQAWKISRAKIAQLPTVAGGGSGIAVVPPPPLGVVPHASGGGHPAATHRCRMCRAYYRYNANGSLTLTSTDAGPCCRVAELSTFIEPLPSAA